MHCSQDSGRLGTCSQILPVFYWHIGRNRDFLMSTGSEEHICLVGYDMRQYQPYTSTTSTNLSDLYLSCTRQNQVQLTSFRIEFACSKWEGWTRTQQQGNQNGLFATPPQKTWKHSHPQEKINVDPFTLTPWLDFSFGCMEILFLKLAATIFGLSKNTLPLNRSNNRSPNRAVLGGMKVLLKLYQMPIPARTSLAVDSMPTLVKNALPNQ